MGQAERAGYYKKPLMLIGPVGAGKSTLIKTLGLDDPQEIDKPEKVKKTSSIVYFSQSIDTPGEMITIPHFYNALILNSARARLILFLINAQKPLQMPPRLALAMRAPVIGVINKIDIATEDCLIKAQAALQIAGVKEFFEISTVTGAGIDRLRKFIQQT